ncbi:MAG TPA: hypothetical protein VGM26_02690 [Rhizomicrobium sp.]
MEIVECRIKTGDMFEPPVRESPYPATALTIDIKNSIGGRMMTLAQNIFDFRMMPRIVAEIAMPAEQGVHFEERAARDQNRSKRNIPLAARVVGMRTVPF